MRDQLITAMGALLALAAVIGLAIADRESPLSRPTSPEAGLNGYRALADWLRQNGVPVVSHRQRWTDLAEYGEGNVFIATLPFQTPLDAAGDQWRNKADADAERLPGEAALLRAWIASGNTLLAMAALDDTPDWAIDAGSLQGARGGAAFEDDLEAVTGMRFTALAGDDAPMLGAAGERAPIRLWAANAHPLARGVQTLVGESDHLASVWRVAAAPAGPRLRLATLRDYDVDAVWHLPHERGRIFVFALASLFTNRALGEADNAVLFSNLLRHHLAPGKAVIFDDMHQGLTELYDPAAFFNDPRLHVSILFVLGLWLLYMAGAWNRLAPARPAPREATQLDFVRAVGSFLARKLSRAAAGRLMFETWFQSGDGASRGDFEHPPWDQLAANPTVDAATLAALREDHAKLAAGKRIDLRALHARIARLRRPPTDRPAQRAP